MTEGTETQPTPTPSPTLADGTVGFELRETGATHTVTGQGVVPIVNEDGSPDSEYVLYAVVNGQKVVLESYSPGRIAIIARVEQARQDAAAQAAE